MRAANMDRIKGMKKIEIAAEIIFSKMGKTRWDGNDAFVVINKQSVKLVLSPNTGCDRTIPTQVIIDEIYVPPRLRRKGNASKAMTALCHLADKYKFVLLGGPIGFISSPWRDKYVEWVLGFGFERDPAEHLRDDDPYAFYVRRLPRKTTQGVTCPTNLVRPELAA